MILRLIAAAFIVFGLHYAIKWMTDAAITTQLGEHAQIPAPIKIEPEALRKAMEYSRIGTPAQRAVIDDANRRIKELDRNMPPPLPPNIPVTVRH